MPRKSKDTQPKRKNTSENNNAYIEGAGIVASEDISDTLINNYMPYAMSVIISRALPEIDGFKPSHRKLLYTMYKMGLLNSQRTKSANIVGQTMKLNPHGDMAIYETMVRMTRGNEALLHPYIDSKGNFGKAYSRDMKFAAARYTEAKLDPICAELFGDIDKETVDFVPNYDNQLMEPTLLPARFPSILVNSNVGIAVSMASNICPFNLEEVCATTIALIKDPCHDILSTLKGPDFPGGGHMLYNESELEKIVETGKGSVKVRSVYRFNKEESCIEVTQIPPTTTVEAIIEKIIELVKLGKIKEISYVRDETGLNGMTLAIDVKRGTDPDKLMQKLFRMTPLQDSFACNFNVLIAGTPKVMGIRSILEEWIAFRVECIRRRTYFDLKKKKDKLHLLKGLKKILLDIDKAVQIVRETQEESEVVTNLMIGFGIDEIQAEYVAEIKLRHLNRQYILNRIDEVDELEKTIAELEDILSDSKKIKKIIISELKDISQKYKQPRKTLFIYETESESDEPIDDTPDYNVNIFVTNEGYIKKITPQSLRMSGEQKLKEGDFIASAFETTNKCELLFFTDMCRVYKARAFQFDDCKASLIGDFVPAKLAFAENENLVASIALTEYKGHVIFVFENGKVAKVPLSAYETKTNRKKLTGAFSDKSKLVKIIYAPENTDILLRTDNNRALLFNTGMLLQKTTRDTIGVQVMTLRAKHTVTSALAVSSDELESLAKFKAKTLPAAGSLAKELEQSGQISFDLN